MSVITPSFNCGDYLPRLVESILRQTWRTWELIIVDDGSTDHTREFLDSLSDQRIICIYSEHAGVSVARNKGLEEARGEFITFVDADDILPPRSLEARVTLFVENSQVHVVDGLVPVIGSDNQVQRIHRPYYRGALYPKLLALDPRVFMGVCYMFRASILHSTRFREDLNYCEDWMFYLDICKAGTVHYGYVDEIVYLYCKRKGSSTASGRIVESAYLRILTILSKEFSLPFLVLCYIKYRFSRVVCTALLRKGHLLQAVRSLLRLCLVSH